jgi:hypothetical protein
LIMKCTNCGLPLSPTRTTTNCPRCGTPINTLQQQPFEQQAGWGNAGNVPQQPFEQQAGWGNAGGVPPQNPWMQVASTTAPKPYPPAAMPNQGASLNGLNGSFRPGLQQSSFPPRRPYEQPKKPKNTQIMFIIAGLCVVLSALILIFVAVIGSSNSGNSSATTVNTNASAANSGTATANASQSTATPTTATTNDATPTPAASAPTDGTPAANGTPYPGQQYINNAQMAAGVDNSTLQPQNPTTTFKSGSNMYVIFSVNPPSTGGEVCLNWYLNGTQITQSNFPVKGTSRGSYAYAVFGAGSSGSAYVELYWATDSSCDNKTLAQHIDFTVTT